MDAFALILVIIGAINWGIIAIFRFDFIATIFGGSSNILSRLIYGLIGLSGLYCIKFLLRNREKIK
ncbi:MULTISPECIES: DUF378 domain-containing protein [Tissierellales]|jgi:hypothetical protein|uniref:DUF378 domain-containing protein n=1 Tax=Acidilutibacter cellobiosedens TaxID=2507161 RepID=A0A410QB96_9FIRM|nr:MULTISPECIES: DUF378 domain-containing protein [Tissierellales]MBE6081932.1 DUF378 domain-containing protein [Tissierellaceae bacterium]QAT61265.1 DUF378 domain-containing protein [Acidilutibacter cellobiosedens]SCL96257.1 hypothetical protein PP176A_3049 [Sporanaerobacter sp. PP17-6a]